MSGAKAPVNFSWVIDGILGGMGYPKSVEDYQFLLNQNVKYLVSLTEIKPKCVKEIELISIPIGDFSPPTMDQINQFIDITDKAKKEKKGVVVHCQMGQGRTGTMIACYLVKDMGVSAKKAVETIRHLRPGSVETKEQEDMVAQYEKELKEGGEEAETEHKAVDPHGKIPKEFTWIVNGRIGGMAFPDNEDYFRFLVNQGVGFVVSLTEEPAKTNVKGIEIVSIPVVDYTPPSMDQVYQFQDAVDKAIFERKGLVVHCLGGHGRTGTMLACYLVKHFQMPAQKAIEEIRRMRPGSVETDEQEKLIADFEKELENSAGPYKVGNEGKIPKEFTWVVNGQLGGMAYPKEEAFFQFLVNQGVKYVVSLTEEPVQTKIKGIEIISIPIIDYTPPTLDQVQEFIKVTEKAEDEHAGVVVHCLGGHGRTGTMLACFLVKHFKLSAQDAIDEIRRMRPGSVETAEQEQLIAEYAGVASIESAKLPKEFSWIQPGFVGGMAYPEKEEYFEFLQNQGVKYVVSLTEEPAETKTDIQVVSIPVVDYTPPKIEQVHEFLDVVSKADYEKQGVVVHCLGGHGRTGTMLACFMVKYMGMEAEKAIDTLRRMRPGSVETKEQEELIGQFAKSLNRVPNSKVKDEGEIPKEFTWIVNGEMGGMAYPDQESYFQFLANQGVKYVVSLTETPASTKNKAIEIVSVPVQDYTPPKMEQVETYIKLAEKAKKERKGVVVHCLGGHGRTGTMLACYMVKFLGLSGKKAISEIRRLRPGSVETKEQEELICEFAHEIENKTKLPKEFSWIVDGVIGGMAFPKEETIFRFLAGMNVGYVVSLTEEPSKTSVKEIEIVPIGIIDYTPPTIDQVFQFTEAVDKAMYENKALVVHCLGGHGRTGTMLACFLVKYRHMSAQKAINEIRRLRPGSVETTEQEELIAEFENVLKRGPTKVADEGKIPKEFTWVVPGVLAGMAYPDKDPEYFRFLANQGIRYVVSLTEEPSKTTVKEITIKSIAIVDYTPPTLEQVFEFISIMEQAKEEKVGVVVHCLGGHGRTGTMLACYLVKYLGRTAKEAIEEIRRSRPGSVETEEQEQLIAEFEGTVQESEGKLPKEFSWITEGQVGGMAFPDQDEYFRFLVNQGVKYVVSLTEEPAVAVTVPEIEIISIPVIDYTPPTLEQVYKFLEVVDQANFEQVGVVVHCLGGHGRTGTMLACYMVRHLGYSGQDAIAELRRLRPGSVETKEQEELIAKFDGIVKQSTVTPSALEEAKLPKEFSWVVENELAGMAYPDDERYFLFLYNQGIKYIVSLTEEPVKCTNVSGIKVVSIPIVDYTPPTMQQVEMFIKVMETARKEKKGVVVHCLGGHGRTGTMLTCYLVKYQNFTTAKALQEIRRMRPGSVETKEQEQLIAEFERSLKNQK